MINRGEIYFIKRGGNYQGNEIAKDRPGVVISANHLNHGGCVEVVYLTSQPKKDMDEHVVISINGRTSTVICEQICSVTEERLTNFYGRVSDLEMENIDNALMASLGLSRKPESPVNTRYGADSGRLEIERDMYKGLYEQLLDKLTR